MNKIIDGKKIAQRLKDTLKIEIENIKEKFKLVPGLAVIQVGNVAASSVYVKAKTFYKNIINIPPVGLYILFFIFCYIGIYGNVTHYFYIRNKLIIYI